MTLRGIPRLRDDQLVITVSDPEFSPLVASLLGDELTERDGWDNDIAAVAALLGPDQDLVDSLTESLLDMEFVDGDFATAVLSPLAADTGKFTQDGDALFSAMADAIGNDPTKAPPDDGGGGGEGGGGGGGGGGGTGGGGEGGGGGGGDQSVRCHLVIAKDGGSQYVCEVVSSGGGGAHHPPLLE